MAKLSVPVLLISSAWFGAETSPDDMPRVRASFDKHHKPYEWWQIEFRDAAQSKVVDFNVELFTKVADYLEQTMK